MAFYREYKSINFNFLAEKISSDGAVLLQEKFKRKHELISSISKIFPD